MNRIKVIKKNANFDKKPPLKIVKSNIKSDGREAAEIIKSWITSWREQKEISNRRAINEIFSV